MSRLDLYGPDQGPALDAARAALLQATVSSLRVDLTAKHFQLGQRGKALARLVLESPLLAFLTVRPWSPSSPAEPGMVLSPRSEVLCRHVDRLHALRCLEARRVTGGYMRQAPAGCFGPDVVSK